jgi:Na+/proline symporter/signal transduction histidine kinase/CheY-like chemotaxis protein
MFSGWLLAALAVGYLALLFALAFYGEKHRVYPLNARLRPVIYSLALGVYCSTWTFFGAVGSAVRDGVGFLPIYLGPAIVFVAVAPYFERLVRIARARNITSIADFLASRFGKSPSLAAIVTLLALTASIPYLALQYKAVAASFAVLTAGTTAATAGPWYHDAALGISMLLALFAALFGTRRVEAAEHHEGLMLAIAFESLVKLVAFVSIALYCWGELGPLVGRLPMVVQTMHGTIDADFVVTTTLAAAAIVLLPRQFQIGVVECAEPADVRRARWLFPAYLALFSISVLPIAALGVAGGQGLRVPDVLVLSLPMAHGAPLIALAAFLGGLSAASAMVIVASLALATMVTNDLIVPAIWRRQLAESADLGGRVLWLRRLTIFGLALLAFGYYRLAGASASLASIGLLAFAAVVQFAPGIISGIWWRGATRQGVFWGLVAGFACWLWLLVVPSLGGRVVNPSAWALAGHDHLSGLAALGPTARGALIALGCNIALLVGISLRVGTTLQQRFAAKAFTSPARTAASGVAGEAKVGDLEALVARIVGPAAARRMLAEHAATMQQALPRHSDPADRALLQRVERELAGALGASSARALLTHALSRRGLDVDEVAELLDETSQELRFSRQLMQATMENVAQGISVIDADLKLVAWNRRYVEMFRYPDGFIYVGRDIADVIRANAERGECGPGTPAEHVDKRLAHLRSGTAYVIQRVRRSGRVYEIRGQPMPGGGYVTTYTDITEFKRTEQELREAKHGLETRVEQRTLELQGALAAQQVAKRLAEDANASKTRFVAAASHDLLQPLNAARLFASALAERSASEPPLVEIATRIDSALRAAEDLLDGLLDVARLDSGALSPDRTVFSVGELLADLERQFAPVAAARGLALRVVPTDEMVHTDRVLLRRILQNYLANALRYTRAGGVLVGCRRRGGELLVTVSDTGPGIAAEQQGAIFQEFTRLDRASPWGEKGLGLGLAICDRVARLLGHRLELSSRPGHGSTFGVRVPRAAAGSVATAVRVTARDFGSDLGGLVALCLDNEPAILDGMEMLLARWGARVVKAANPEEAATAFAAGGIDVVLADFHLGGPLDGIDVLERCRLLAGGRLAAAVLTADYDPALVQRARVFGWPVLRKPLKPAALRALLMAVRAGVMRRGAVG